MLERRFPLESGHSGREGDIKCNSENVNIGVVNENNANNVIIAHAHAPVTIINNGTVLSEREKALIDIFRRLDIIKQSQLLAGADALEKCSAEITIRRPQSEVKW